MFQERNLPQLPEILTSGEISNTHPSIVGRCHIKGHPPLLAVNHPCSGTGQGMKPHLIIDMSGLGCFSAQELPPGGKIIEEISHLHGCPRRAPRLVNVPQPATLHHDLRPSHHSVFAGGEPKS